MLLNIGVAITCLFLAGLHFTGLVKFFETGSELKNVTIILWKVDSNLYPSGDSLPLINSSTQEIDPNNVLHHHLVELLANYFIKMNRSLIEGDVNNAFVFDKRDAAQLSNRSTDTGVDSRMIGDNGHLLNPLDANYNKFNVEKIAVVDYLFSNRKTLAVLERLIQDGSHILAAPENNSMTSPSDSLDRPYISLHDYLDSFTSDVGQLGLRSGAVDSSAAVLFATICCPLVIVLLYVAFKKQTMHIHVGKEFTEGFSDVKSSLTDLLHYSRDVIRSQKRVERRLAVGVEEKVDSMMLAFLTLQNETVCKQANLDRVLVDATFENIRDMQHVMRLINLSEYEQQQRLDVERQHFMLEQNYKRSLEATLKEELAANLSVYTAQLTKNITECQKMCDQDTDHVVKEALNKRIAALMKHRDEVMPEYTLSQRKSRLTSEGSSADTTCLTSPPASRRGSCSTQASSVYESSSRVKRVSSVYESSSRVKRVSSDSVVPSRGVGGAESRTVLSRSSPKLSSSCPEMDFRDQRGTRSID